MSREASSATLSSLRRPLGARFLIVRKVLLHVTAVLVFVAAVAMSARLSRPDVRLVSLEQLLSVQPAADQLFELREVTLVPGSRVDTPGDNLVRFDVQRQVDGELLGPTLSVVAARRSLGPCFCDPDALTPPPLVRGPEMRRQLVLRGRRPAVAAPFVASAVTVTVPGYPIVDACCPELTRCPPGTPPGSAAGCLPTTRRAVGTLPDADAGP